MNARRARHLNGKLICTALIFAALVVGHPSRSFASGSDYTRSTKDLTITVDSRWAGGRYGGYVPVRIRVSNTGKEQELEFRFSPDMGVTLPVVRRRVTVGQNETRQFTLAVPMVGGSGYGSYAGGALTVYRDGRAIKDLTNSITLPEDASGVLNCPSLLVISPFTKIDFDQFTLAVNSQAAKRLATSPSSSGFGGWGGSYSEDHEAIPPSLLPDNALDYSGLDIVALSWETLENLADGPRGAILDWVRTGGKLIVYETGARPEKVKGLNELLGLSDGEAWQEPDVHRRIAVDVMTEEQFNSGQTWSPNEGQAEVARYDWARPQDSFAIHPLMLGHVFAITTNPFPGTPHDWGWLLNSLENDTWRWTQRQGVSTRHQDTSAMEFAIPGVGGVPTFAFIVLISGFTIVIGPLNYFLLKRRRQLYLLVVTIPAIAFLTSCALFAYAAISDGFGVTSRTRSFTLLDQTTKTAVSLSRSALYAGMAPSDGLNFTNDTAVFPIWSVGQDPPDGAVDETGGQHFINGWIRSRTPMQFLTQSLRTERGRIEITSAGANALNVANGLAWNIELLVVIDENGDTYLTRSLPAGASAKLETVEVSAAKSTLVRMYEDHPLDVYPDSMSTPGASSRPMITYSGATFLNGSDVQANYVDGLLEGHLAEYVKPKVADNLRNHKRSYIAILTENPNIELGVEATDARGDFHVLVGRY